MKSIDKKAVWKDLSDDQALLYDFTTAIRTGNVSPGLHSKKLGPMDHSRWLTLALRMCRLYISQNNLSGKDLRNLNLIVTFIVSHYAPMWFEIKFEPYYSNGRHHLLTSIKLFRSLPSTVKGIVEPYIRRNAYFGHSENILIAMLADPDQEVRKKAIKIIKNIRKDAIFGDDSPRQFNVPKINFAAEEIDELIDWQAEVIYEPVITAQMGIYTLQKIENERLFLGKFECHTQAIERTVKDVTKACKAVVGQARRDGNIKTGRKSRKFHPKSNTKKDYINMVKSVESLSSEED